MAKSGSLAEAKACLGRREFARAVEKATEAILAAPRDAVAYTVRAEALRKLGHPDRAMADVAVAIRIAPDRASPFVIRSEILRKRCLFDQAIADATQAIFLDPDNAAAFSIRADCRLAIGDADGAAFDAQELFRIDPTRPPSHPASPPTPTKDDPGTMDRGSKRTGGVARRRDDSVFEDGDAVDRSLKSRYVISPEEAAERLAEESGYRPGIIPRPLPRTRASRSSRQAPLIAAAIVVSTLLATGVLVMSRRSEVPVPSRPLPEIAPVSRPEVPVQEPPPATTVVSTDRGQALEGEQTKGEVAAEPTRPQGARDAGTRLRRLRVSVGETGECVLIVDGGADEPVEEPREGELSLAGLSDARIVKGEDGRLKITHLFHEVKGISDFSYLEDPRGVSLSRGDGTLVLTPVPIPGQPGKVCMLNYPKRLRPPITVTLDLEKLPPASTLNVQVEKPAQNEKLVIMIYGDGNGSRLKAIWYPVDRKKALTLLDQAIESRRAIEQVLQLPRAAIAMDTPLNLRFGYWGGTPAAIRSLEVEGRIVPSFGVVMGRHPTLKVAVIKSVAKDQPADRAGLRAGDIIDSIGGEKVREQHEAMLLFGRAPIGEDFKVGIRRGGKPIEFMVKPE